MDDLTDSKMGFFKHVFNFDDDSKSDILNIIQYSVIAIIPIVVLNKLMSKYVPEADDKKGSLEVSAEIVTQIIVMFIGLLIIHRIIVFIPTYSAQKYPEFNVVCIILAVLMITMSLQTKLGEKVSILVERLMELWNGKSEQPSNQGKNRGNIKISQPISGQQQQQQQQMMNPATAAVTQSLYTDGTPISSLPTSDTQQSPNYDNMYRQDNNPLVGAATPGMSMEPIMEPMAANSMIGGGFGSSW